MSRLAERLAALPPEKRALLQRRLLQARRETAPAPPSIPRQPRDASAFPLSSSQERMWFNYQWKPDSPLYNETFALRLRGPLRVDLIEQSFDAVMHRHDMFRTTFRDVDGQPMQSVSMAAPPRLDVVDLRSEVAQSAGERDERLRQRSKEVIHQIFNLAEGPLFRGTLYRLGERECVLLCVMHHIIFDGWSIALFIRELLTLYDALCRQVPGSLPELPIQYIDYAVWQRAWLQHEVMAQQLPYWRERLRGAPGALDLPTDRPRPAQFSNRGARILFQLSRSLTADLRALSAREGTTLFMTLLAGFKVLLYRYTGQEDMVVGTPTTNRSHRETEGLVGVFINTLPLRTRLSEALCFRDVLHRVQEVAIGAYAHQDIPFEMLVEVAQPARDVSRTPLFQVLFNLYKTPTLPVDLPDIDIALVDEIHSDMAKFDVTLSIEETAHTLKGGLEYSTDLFDAPTITRMLGHFETVLAAAVQTPDARLVALPLLTSAERQQILTEWNATDVVFPQEQSVASLVAAQAERTPDAVAVVWEEQALTYGELNTKANRVAHYLHALGIGPERVVGICVARSLDMIVGQLGVLKSGGVYLPLDPVLPVDRLRFMLSDAHVTVVLTQEKFAPVLAGGAWNLVCLDRDWEVVARQSEANPAGDGQLEHGAYVIYTSGSTGQPKGVLISHRSLLNLIFWHRHAFAIGPGDKATQLAGIAFDASVWEVWPYLTVGASLYLVPPNIVAEPAGLRDWLVAQGITVSFLPTPLAETVLHLDWPRDISLRLMLTGGDMLHQYPPASLPFTLVNNYGPTEHTVVATSGTVAPTEGASTAPGIGRPIANTQVYVLDRHLQPLPIGVPGELYIGGHSLARGYLNRPDLTDSSFIAHPFRQDSAARLYKTGDIVRYRADGTIAFLGREGRQVQVRGFRIELGEIEAVLAQHPKVREAVVSVSDVPDGFKRLIAYVSPETPNRVCSGDTDAAESALARELRLYLQTVVPAYMVPTAFVVLEVLPLTHNGKIDRDALPAPRRTQVALEHGFVPPRTDLEVRLAACWAEVLGLDKVSIDDDFFDLGGYSLLATRLASAIQKSLQRDVPLLKIFESPTVAGIARWLDTAEKTAVVSPDVLPACVIPMQPQGHKPPVFFVPPASGSPLCYVELALQLGDAQPAYGLQAPGLYDDAPLITRLEDMAAYYVAAMRYVQPAGPYHLVGWSFGSMVAFEMARLLEQQHEAVAFLGLLDTGLAYDPRRSPGAPLQDLLLALRLTMANMVKVKFPTSYRDLKQLASWFGVSLPASLQHLWQRDLSSQWAFLRYLLGMSLRSFKLFRSNFIAGQQYVAAPYGGHATLFRTTPASAALPPTEDAVVTMLRTFVEGGLEVHYVPGNHMTLLETANVGILAQKIKAALAQA